MKIKLKEALKLAYTWPDTSNGVSEENLALLIVAKAYDECKAALEELWKTDGFVPDDLTKRIEKILK